MTLSRNHVSPVPEAPFLKTGSKPSEPEPFESLPWTGITVVIAVIGLLLFMAVPMRRPSADRLLAAQRAFSEEMAIEEIHRAVEDYHNDHGAWPGCQPTVARTLGAPIYRAEWLVRQLTMSSDSHGGVGPADLTSFPFGPYMPNGIPTNPRTGLSSVYVLAEGESFRSILPGIFGWVYDPRCGEVRPHRTPLELNRHASR